MIQLTINGILNLLEERSRLFVGWTKDEEVQFNAALFELRTELRAALIIEANNSVEDNSTNFSLSDDECDLLEAKNDLVLGIDNILLFEFNNPLIFTKKDIMFFWLTFLFLNFNGYFIVAIIYFFVGMHMAFSVWEEEIDTHERKVWEKLSNWTLRAYYISYMRHNKNKKHLQKYLTLNERLNICNNCIYKHYSKNHKIKNTYDLILKKGPIDNYKYFINIYYNFIFYYNIKFKLHLLNIINIKLFKDKLHRKYLNNLNKVFKLKQGILQNVKINNYTYFYLNKEIYFSYYCKIIKPNNKIQIFYLNF